MQVMERLIRQLTASLEQKARDGFVQLVLKLFWVSVASLFMAAGGIFAFIGLYLYLAQLFQVWLAALLTGVALVVLSNALLLISLRSPGSHTQEQSRPDTSKEQRGTEGNTAEELGKMAGSMLSRSSPRATDVAMIALVAGIALGISGGRRGRKPPPDDEH